MASYQDVLKLIQDFQKIKSPAAISPESLGFILRAIHEYPEEVVWNHDDIWEFINNLQAELIKTNKALDKAQADATRAQATADAAMPPTIAVADLDTLGTDGTVQAIYALLKDKPHTRYRVVTTYLNDTFTVGTLDVFCDSLRHVVTEVFTSNYIFTDGVLQTDAHRDDTITVQYRMLKLTNSGTLPGDVGKWTAWTDLLGKLTARLDAAWETIGEIRNEDIPGAVAEAKKYTRDYINDNIDPTLQDLETDVARHEGEIDGIKDRMNDFADKQDTETRLGAAEGRMDELDEKIVQGDNGVETRLNAKLAAEKAAREQGDEAVKSELNTRIDGISSSVEGSHNTSSLELGRLECREFKLTIPDTLDIMDFPPVAVEKYELAEGDIVWSEKLNGFAFWTGEEFSADWGEMIETASDDSKAQANAAGKLTMADTVKFRESEYYGMPYPSAEARVCRRPARRAFYRRTSDSSLWVWDGAKLVKVADIEELKALRTRLETLIGKSNVTDVIDTFNEIEAFLQGVTNTETLTGLLEEMKSNILERANDNVNTKLSSYISKNIGDVSYKTLDDNFGFVGKESTFSDTFCAYKLPLLFNYMKAKAAETGSGFSADLLDGMHASQLFDNLSTDSNNYLKISIGGTTKSIQPQYAINSGNLKIFELNTGINLDSIRNYYFTVYTGLSNRYYQNNPAPNEDFTLHCFRSGENFYFQIIYTCSGKIFCRGSIYNGLNTIYDSWKQCFFSNDTAAGAESLKDSDGIYLDRTGVTELRQAAGIDGRPPQAFIEQFIAATKLDNVNILRDFTGSFVSTAETAIAPSAVYNEESGFFEWNGLNDISYSDAIEILWFQRLINLGLIPKSLNVRTFNIYVTDYSQRCNALSEYGMNSKKIEVVRYVATSYSNNIYPRFTSSYLSGFDNLHTIIGEITCVNASSWQNQAPHWMTPNLREVRFKGATGYFENCPKLSYDSVAYYVQNNSSELVVHPDVYAKLMGDMTNQEVAKLTQTEVQAWMQLRENAVAKGITISTTT